MKAPVCQCFEVVNALKTSLRKCWPARTSASGWSSFSPDAEERGIDERHVREGARGAVGEVVGDRARRRNEPATPKREERQVGRVVRGRDAGRDEPVPDRRPLERNGWDRVVHPAVRLAGVQVEAVRERRAEQRRVRVVAHGEPASQVRSERQVRALVVPDARTRRCRSRGRGSRGRAAPVPQSSCGRGRGARSPGTGSSDRVTRAGAVSRRDRSARRTSD